MSVEDLGAPDAARNVRGAGNPLARPAQFVLSRRRYGTSDHTRHAGCNKRLVVLKLAALYPAEPQHIEFWAFALAVEHIHTYLVHPGKASEGTAQIGGTDVKLEGKLFRLLSDIYVRSDRECDIEISFNHATDGTQQNPCRDLILDYLRGPTLVRGRRLAERLEKVTTNRSGLGLLFLIAGKEGRNHKIVVSRFPADSAILAEEDKQALTVQFLERVFMKSATAYKAALYQDSSLPAGFWTGRAVDKQINNREVQLSNYWIGEFLDSDFRTTSAAGTRRLAVALRNAAKKSRDIAVKSQIASAVTLAGGLKGRRISINDFSKQFELSEAARQAIADEIKQPDILAERFQFDATEFAEQVPYRSVELDSGALLTAQSSDFDKVFERQVVDIAAQRVRYSAEGKVVSQRLAKTK
jgi:hypothetical protein